MTSHPRTSVPLAEAGLCPLALGTQRSEARPTALLEPAGSPLPAQRRPHRTERHQPLCTRCPGTAGPGGPGSQHARLLTHLRGTDRPETPRPAQPAPPGRQVTRFQPNRVATCIPFTVPSDAWLSSPGVHRLVSVPWLQLPLRVSLQGMEGAPHHSFASALQVRSSTSRVPSGNASCHRRLPCDTGVARSCSLCQEMRPVLLGDV